MPTFYNGMCYVIECNIPIDSEKSNFESVYYIWLTVEKISEIKEVDLRVTPQYEYLSVIHSPRLDYRPFMITVPFGSLKKQRILAVENEIRNFNCQVSHKTHANTNFQYLSFEQCIVDLFVFSDFLQCPTKCVPIQMKGFKYINESLTGKFF